MGSGQVRLIARRRELGPRGRSSLAGWAVVGIGQSLTGAGILEKRPGVVVVELVFGAPTRHGNSRANCRRTSVGTNRLSGV